MEEKLKWIIEEVENLKSVSEGLDWKYKIAVSHTINQVDSLLSSALGIANNMSDLIQKIKNSEPVQHAQQPQAETNASVI